MKEVISLLTALTMLFALIPAATATAEETDSRLIAYVSFDDGIAAEIGGVKVNGSVTTDAGVNGNAAYIPSGTANYLTITDKDGNNNLLVGKNVITISFFENRESGRWPFFAAPNTSAQTYMSENYFGLYDNDAFRVERYVGGRGQSTSSQVVGSIISGWKHIAIVLTDDRTDLYVNGQLQNSAASASTIAQLFPSVSYIQLGRGNWGSGGEDFVGYIDEFKIFDGELSPEEIAELSKYGTSVEEVLAAIDIADKDNITSDIELITEYMGAKISWNSSNPDVITNDGKVTRGSEDIKVTLTATITTDMGETKTQDYELTVISTLKDIIKAIEIHNTDNILDSITLRDSVDGVAIKWTSSNPAVVTDEPVQNGEYVIPAGYVTRGESDEQVTVTAEFEYNGKTVTQSYDLTVKERNYERENEEKVAYLYAYFRGNVNGQPEVQQIHVATSEDGYNWTDLNGNWPIITSSMGTKNLRDPYIIRSRYGDKFYLLATDLDTQDGQGWGPWSLAGSKYLMVWESEDLVNWSEQYMVKFANDDIGCAWAPEAIYDEDTGEYLVYASGKDLAYKRETGKEVDTTYVVRTRDFQTFTEPEIFFIPRDASGNRVASIDSSIIHADDGKYYHFFKKWNSTVVMMVSDHAAGPYEEVSTFTGIGGEGPAIYKVNGSDKYCLCIDNYSVYVPYLTDDIASGIFTKATEDVTMPTGSKHGTFVPITKSEYAGLLEAYGPKTVDEEGSEAILEYDFETELKDELKGNAKIEFDEERNSSVLTLDGTDGTYFEFPENTFERRNSFTLSMDVKSNVASGNVFTFGVGRDSDHYYFFKDTANSLRSSITITGSVYEETASANSAAPATGEWAHFDLVVEPSRLAIYKDGALVGENTNVVRTLSHVGVEDLKAYLGKSFYSADGYFSGSFDNVKLYNRALTTGEIVEGFLSDDEIVAADAKYIDFGGKVSDDITLPAKGVYGSAIVWETSNPDVIGLDGSVNRPAVGDEDAYVTLTATFTKGESALTVKYNLTVKAEAETWVSTADWTCRNFDSVSDTVYINFDIIPSALTDGVMGICSSDVTPGAWSNYNIVVRLRPEGYFGAHNGSSYTTTNKVTYEVG
ncbi:MAG: immunoglobulin-like domain-containing protein, partial [Clostridia bacterium]